jgi:hypothetical protein
MNGSQGGSRKLIGEQGQLHQGMCGCLRLDCAHTLQCACFVG